MIPKVLMPEELSAEEGHKSLLNGEFEIITRQSNPDFCGCKDCWYCLYENGMTEEFIVHTVVPWTTIKDIYKKIVEFEKNKLNHGGGL